MPAIAAKRCTPVHSSWVAQIIECCDGKLAVQYRDGVTCYYPGTDSRYEELMIVWGSKGRFVWRWLGREPHRIQAYRIIRCPCPAVGCPTQVGLASSLNPSTVGQAVTFTATVTNPAGVLTPAGTVEFYDGSTDLGPGSALSGSGGSASSTFTTSGLSAGSHTIKAVFTPETGSGWATSNGTLTQVVQSSGIDTSCCSGVPATVTATVTGGGGCNGSYSLTNIATDTWAYSGVFGTCNSLDVISLLCSGTGVSGWRFSPGFMLSYSPTAGSTCSPLSLVFTGVDLTGCGGTNNATITVTV